MKYQVRNAKTGKLEGNDCIVTQDGLVAFWDEGQGWSVEKDQTQYVIEMLDDGSEEDLRSRYLESDK